MRIVFFTKEDFESNELFLYMYAHIASRFEDCSVVAVQRSHQKPSFSKRLRRLRAKMNRLSWLQALELISSYRTQAHLSERQHVEAADHIKRLPRPTIGSIFAKTVKSVNGPDAVELIRSLNPDILIQAGVGILRPQIFTLPRIACLNLHHGIAPLIRGMSSIRWALLEDRPEWIGSTIHEIDEDIDTGNVLAYAPIEPNYAGEGYPSLFARATEQGVARMIEVLSRLQSGERWSVPPMQGKSEYRSTMSGWKLAALERKLNAEKNSRILTSNAKQSYSNES